MKLIDADKIIEALRVFNDREHGDPHFLNGIETAREIVEGMSEEVVRCGDCRYYKETERWCRRLGLVGAFDNKGFCSRGERRTDDA